MPFNSGMSKIHAFDVGLFGMRALSDVPPNRSRQDRLLVAHCLADSGTCGSV